MRDCSQTGSGKTHTMGTAFETGTIDEDDVGVIPRAISHVFRYAGSDLWVEPLSWKLYTES